MSRKHVFGFSCIKVGVALLSGGFPNSRGRDKKGVRACGLYVRVVVHVFLSKMYCYFTREALDSLDNLDTIYIRVR